MEVTDDNIIKLLQKNANDAYFYIYKKLYAPLCSFAIYYLHNKEAADDIVQEVFVSLLDNKKKFSDYQELRYYMYKTVKNKSLNYIRHEFVKDGYCDDSVMSHMESDSFHRRMLEEDVYSNLIFAIEKLPPKCKTVVKLTMEGYKTTEIAEKLSITSDTVKEHKSNAKNRLREVFKHIDKIYFII